MGFAARYLGPNNHGDLGIRGTQGGVVMSECASVSWSAEYREPAPLPRAEPGEVDRVQYDLSNDIDCDGAGVTIANATWSIRTEDDDGLLTLSGGTFSGTIASILLTHDATVSQRIYSVLGLITTSDGRTLRRWFTQPVVPICPLYA